MDKQNARNILARYRANSCPERERQLVEDWVMYGAAHPFDLSDEELLQDLLDIRLRLECDLSKEKSQKTQGFRIWLLYAAAMIVMGIIGIWALWSSPSMHQKNKTISLASEDILPGGNRARLTLADGHTIDLNIMHKEIIIGDEITYADGSAVLSSGNEVRNSNSATSKNRLRKRDTSLLTLSTPKGGTYQVALSDGSKIWLNSDSKLTYPSHFGKDKRIVELEGEAYFEIAASSRVPFHVKTRNQAVEVLGTQFNISAYGDEPEVKTTLVEGSVRVALANKTSSAILKPGEQSIVVKDKATVNEVDVDSFIGWKEGYFIFNGTQLPVAMKQISRWYNVEITYEGIIPNTPFYGKISRHDTLAEVLTILKAGKVKFRIEKHGTTKRLIVM